MFFRQSLPRQLILVTLIFVLTYALFTFFGFRPLLRGSYAMCGAGVLRGVFLFGLITVAQFFIAAFWRDSIFLVIATDPPARSRAERISLVLGSAGGEEFLLRGFLFAPLAAISGWIAYPINLLAGFLMHFSTPSAIHWAVLRAVEGSLLAFWYDEYRSMCMIFSARLVTEFGYQFVWSNPTFAGYCNQILGVFKLFKLRVYGTSRRSPKRV